MGNVGLDKLHIIILRKYWYEKGRGRICYACRVQNFGLPLNAYNEIAHRPKGCVRSLEKACVQVQPGILALLRYS